VLKKEAGRLNALMTDLIEYGRPRQPSFVRCSFATIVGEAIAACGILAERESVTIAADVDPDLPAIETDPHRLTHALQNVVQNAIQHAPPGSTVRVDAHRGRVDDQSAVVCRVSDAGPGFAAADLPQVFDPFFSRRNGGTGLGLAIVQRVVEEHGGTVTAANGPEGGGVVTIAIPVMAV
jgi:signal transduction histidine kinase